MKSILLLTCMTGAGCLFAGEDVANEARVIIGFEQAGASAAKAEQHFFLDFFIDRQMKSKSLSLWGNVRVAGYPQQTNTPVAQFAGQGGDVKVNQLAENAEFAAGLDWHPAALRWSLGSSAERRLGLIFAVGATGPFEPRTRLLLFEVPAPNSPQYARFMQQYPSAAGSAYVGFIPPTRDRFYRAYAIGIRLLTRYNAQEGTPYSPPATYSFSIGQDEAITGGSLRAAVAKFDVFYPLPLSVPQKITGSNSQNATAKVRILYLFGNAGLRLSRAGDITPFVLQQAPTTIRGDEPGVAIIATPSTRDVYRIGIGVDAAAAICALTGGCR